MNRYLLMTLMTILFSLNMGAKDFAKIGDSQFEDKLTYIQEQHLYQGTDGLTLVKLDLEWPEVLNHSTSPALQAYLCQNLFGNAGTSLEKGLGPFLSSKGTEIKQMPDSPGRVSYISIDLYLLLWEQNKYLSFRYSISTRTSTAEKETIEYHFVTYDIENDMIYTAREIIKPRFFPGSYEHEYFSYYVQRFMKYTEEFYVDEIPNECFLHPGGLMLALHDVHDEANKIHLVDLPKDEELEYVMTSKAKKLFKSKGNVRMAPGGVTDTVGTDPEPGTAPEYIYRIVDTHPKLEAEDLVLDQYLTSHVHYPEYEDIMGITGKVTLQFVVELDGSISQVAALRPVSPGLAREAVRVLRETPKWKPAMLHGVPVRSMCSVRISFSQRRGK